MSTALTILPHVWEPRAYDIFMKDLRVENDTYTENGTGYLRRCFELALLALVFPNV